MTTAWRQVGIGPHWRNMHMRVHCSSEYVIPFALTACCWCRNGRAMMCKAKHSICEAAERRVEQWPTEEVCERALHWRDMELLSALEPTNQSMMPASDVCNLIIWCAAVVLWHVPRELDCRVRRCGSASGCWGCQRRRISAHVERHRRDHAAHTSDATGIHSCACAVHREGSPRSLCRVSACRK